MPKARNAGLRTGFRGGARAARDEAIQRPLDHRSLERSPAKAGLRALLPALIGRGWGWVEHNRAKLGVVSRPTIIRWVGVLSAAARDKPKAMGNETAAPYAVLRVDRRKAKAMAAISAASAHQMRQRDTPNADPEGPQPHVLHLADGKTPYQAVSKLLDGAERRNRDTVLCREVVLSAGPSFFRQGREHLGGVFDPPKLKAWVAASLAWARRQWPDQLASAVLHLDEQTPHLHLLVVPRVKNGETGWKLNSKALFDRQRLTEMQTTYARALEHLGIRRGEPGSDAKHAEVKQFYGAVNAAAKLPERAAVPAPPKAPVQPSGIAAETSRALGAALGIETTYQREVKAHQEALRQWREKAKEVRRLDAAAWEQLKARASLAPLARRTRRSVEAVAIAPRSLPTNSRKPAGPR
jgi:hypothetical protein